jgi:predicted nuclease of predicted toxin-antitoxin system
MSVFLLDLGISPKVISLLKSLGHEAKHGISAGFSKTPDRLILDHAIKNSMLLVTTDLGFGELAVFEKRQVPGVIILRLDNPNAEQMMTALKKLLTTTPVENLQQCITVVEPHQIRRTKLPLS